MFCILHNVLDPRTLAAVREEVQHARFIDGRDTAKASAALVKRNLQMDVIPPQLAKKLADAILGNTDFQNYAIPRHLGGLRIARYEPGMEYGYHSDSTFIGGIRTDLSFTLFLAEPSSYEGGELSVLDAGGESRAKLPAGSMVVYPCGAIHRVLPVTAGTRLVAIGWVQSELRDPRHREIVSDLHRVLTAYLERVGPDELSDLLVKTGGNLRRMWSEL